MTLEHLKPGLRHSETLTVGESLTVPGAAHAFPSLARLHAKTARPS